MKHLSVSEILDTEAHFIMNKHAHKTKLDDLCKNLLAAVIWILWRERNAKILMTNPKTKLRCSMILQGKCMCYFLLTIGRVDEWKINQFWRIGESVTDFCRMIYWCLAACILLELIGMQIYLT